MKFAVDSIGQVYAIFRDAPPDFQKVILRFRGNIVGRAPSALLSQPSRFATLHAGPRLLRGEMLAALELSEGTLDLFGDAILPVAEPSVLGAKNFQKPGR
jgi:hypothetical protein